MRFALLPLVLLFCACPHPHRVRAPFVPFVPRPFVPVPVPAPVIVPVPAPVPVPIVPPHP
jgi:hypothetical protein